MLVAKRRWHREATDVWQWHDECKHVRMRKFTNIACGKVIVRKEVGTGEQLDSLSHTSPGILESTRWSCSIASSSSSCGMEVFGTGRSSPLSSLAARILSG